MEKNTLNVDEVIEFMQIIAPNIGDIFSSNMIQRKFRTSYRNAKKVLVELVEKGHIELNSINCVSYHRKK